MKTQVKVIYSQNKTIGKIRDMYSDDKLRKVIFQACSFVRNEAVTNIASGAKTGKIYKRGNKVHQASAVGEFPATDTGELVSGIAQKFTNKGLRGRVESNAPHSAFLEFGTRNMGARPFLQPSLEAVRPKINGLLKRYKVGK